MVTVHKTTVTTEVANFSQTDIEEAIRDRIVAYKGIEWKDAAIRIYERRLDTVMGGIDDRFETVAVCTLIKKHPPD